MRAQIPTTWSSQPPIPSGDDFSAPGINVIIRVLNASEAPKLGEEDTASTPRENLMAGKVDERNPTDPAEMYNGTVSEYSASDDEDMDTTLEWSLSGDDAESFVICVRASDPCNQTGAMVDLNFKEDPSYEEPTDANGDSVYSVNVDVTDGDGNTTSHPVTVTVENVEESGTVTLSTLQPEVGAALSATLTDPDGSITDLEWQWRYVTTEVIGGATSNVYTPVTGDFTQRLIAVAAYTDGEGEDKLAMSAQSVNTVQLTDDDNQAPKFPDQDADPNVVDTDQEREVPENSMAGTIVGDSVVADDGDDDSGTTDNDRLIYMLSGTDSALFTIDTDDGLFVSGTTVPGQIRVAEGADLDYEAKKTYTVTVTATDPSLESDSITVTIKVTDVDEAPEIDRKGLTVRGDSTVSHPENDSSVVTTYTAGGSEGPGATLSLEGTDAGDFLLQGGDLTFRSTPNFEAPTDADTNNVYNVTVKATSGNVTNTRSVTVTVLNVDEPGTVNLSSPGNEVKVGVQLTAELDEGDEEVVTGWQWSSGASDTGPWTNISGATDNTYTPVDGDVGNFLRVTVNYTDATFGGDALSEMTATAVEAATVVIPGTPGSVSLSPTSGLVSGDSISATLTDADNPTNQVWQWQRSSDGSTNWTTVGGSAASYTTTKADAGNFLRASVTYDDDSDTGQTAGPTATTDRVKLHRYDGNSDGSIQRSEVINAINDFLFGSGTSRERGNRGNQPLPLQLAINRT